MAWTYILECADSSYYVGSTLVLEGRVDEHNNGLGSAYTRRPGRRPVTLVWCEEHQRVVDAFRREKQIQGWSRAKRRALIEGRPDDLPGLARGRTGRPEDAERSVDGTTSPPDESADDPDPQLP